MLQAMHRGRLATAGPDAPRRAECPACGWPVVLKSVRGRGWAYYHEPEAPADCPLHRPTAPRRSDPDRPGRRPRWPEDEPEYALALAAIRRAILDALDGGGPGELDWLFSPLAQAGLRRLLNADEEAVLAATQRAVDRLTALVAEGQAPQVRYWLAKGALSQVQEYFR